MSYRVPRAPNDADRAPNDADRGPAFALTPEGERALAQAKRGRARRYRRLVYSSAFMVAFAAGTALGLVLSSLP